jgi:hypothetical protein
MATMATMAAVTAMATVAAAATVASITIAATATMTSNRRVAAAQQGNTDQRDEDRNAEDQSTVHPESSNEQGTKNPVLNCRS